MSPERTPTPRPRRPTTPLRGGATRDARLTVARRAAVEGAPP